jgi:hypothetical protein
MTGFIPVPAKTIRFLPCHLADTFFAGLSHVRCSNLLGADSKEAGFWKKVAGKDAINLPLFLAQIAYQNESPSETRQRQDCSELSFCPLV